MIAHHELFSFFDIVSASDIQLKNCVALMLNCDHEYKFPRKASARENNFSDSGKLLKKGLWLSFGVQLHS